MKKNVIASFVFPFLLLSQLCAKGAGSKSSTSKDTDIVETGDSFTADYVIVGSGPSGAAIAELLTKDKKRSVVVLEAGGDHNDRPVIKYSKNIPKVVFTYASQFSWEQSTVVQTNLKRSFDWVTGRLLGGASAINGTFWIRGDDGYSEWEKFGGKKWSQAHIERVFKYIENYDGTSSNPEFRGRHGRVHVRQPKQTTPTGEKFAQAIQLATGFPIIQDYNDPKTALGTDTKVQWAQKGPNGIYRVSSATAFLGKDVMDKEGFGVKGRKLRVLTDTTALKALWDGKKAIGVETLRKGKCTKIFARKKVIVCAGINSSQFLLLSGIGPRKLLKSRGIEIKHDNPEVGVGVTDQPAVVTVWSCNSNDPVHPPGDPNDVAPFLSFLPDPSGKNPQKRAVQLVARSFVPGSLALGVILCNQKSKGTVGLHSRDPFQMPRVDLGILTDEADLTEYKEAFKKYIQAIAEKLALIDPSYQLLVPDSATINDDALLTQFIKNAVDVPSTVHNYTGHCRMGAVVKDNGDVMGVKNLAVADCSIAPTTTTGACMAMGYMIGTNIGMQILEEEGASKEVRLPKMKKVKKMKGA